VLILVFVLMALILCVFRCYQLVSSPVWSNALCSDGVIVVRQQRDNLAEGTTTLPPRIVRFISDVIPVCRCV
jgi:hypothetical protein